MYKTLVMLSDGTEITSGVYETTYIKSSKLSESVNNSYELTLGSVCSTELELNIVTLENNLHITSGDELTVYKVSSTGELIKVGLFTAEKPTKVSANSYKVTAYDRILKLEKDLTVWLDSLTEWPYSLVDFASMVCLECGVVLATTDFPNKDFPIKQFKSASITGRRIMEWVGQLSARFVRANTEGDIELAWYTPVDVVLRPSGEGHYYSGSLSYEDYDVAPIDTVQIRLADSDAGALWPEAPAQDNSYVIKGNRLITEITEDMLPYVEAIASALGSFTYKPCKVTLPSNMSIRAGSIISVETLKGSVFQTYVMNKTQTGQRDTLECTGSARRDEASTYDDDPRNAADEAAEGALKRQTQLDVFNKLTNNGKSQGLFLDVDGQLFINASYLTTGILASKDGKSFYLDLVNGILKMDAAEFTIAGKSIAGISLEGMTQQEIFDKLTDEETAKAIHLQEGQLYINATYINAGTLNASLMSAGVLQSRDNGETFKLDLDKGTFHMAGTGKFLAEDGKSYITVEGKEFVLCSKAGETGDFIDIIRIGFTEDSEGYDYPYFVMGNAESTNSTFREVGLIKMFRNGLYAGNSAPIDSTGSFIGLAGAAGFFVDTGTAAAYVVSGTDMKELYTGTVDATFA